MINLSQKQIEASNCECLSLLITAPAGCGKTEVLAHRSAFLIKKLNVISKHQKILILTFTNKAKDNIRERLKPLLSTNEFRYGVDVSNFHEFAMKCIRSYGGLVSKVDQSWHFPEDDFWEDEWMNTHGLDWSKKKELKEALRKAKQANLTDESVIQVLTEEKNNLAIEYERNRIENKILTYDDIIRLGTLILQDSRIRDLYFSHYSTVIVDEFQDLTPQELKMIQSFSKGKATFAGDVAQGIFSFAGANPEFVLDALKEECEKHIELSESYRSNSSILEVVNLLCPQTGGINLSAVNKSIPKGLVKVRQFDSEEEESIFVVNRCKEILEKNKNTRIGIISRTTARQATLISQLDRQKVSYFDWSLPEISCETIATLSSLRQVVNIPIDQLYATVCESNLNIDESIKKEIKGLSLWGEQKRRYDENAKVSVGEFVDKCTPNYSNNPGLHILNGHNGKGQQFYYVVILGVEEGVIPDYRARNDDLKLLEEARILSVMVSRAKVALTFTFVRNRQGYSQKISRFLNEEILKKSTTN